MEGREERGGGGERERVSEGERGRKREREGGRERERAREGGGDSTERVVGRVYSYVEREREDISL